MSVTENLTQNAYENGAGGFFFSHSHQCQLGETLQHISAKPQLFRDLPNLNYIKTKLNL